MMRILTIAICLFVISAMPAADLDITGKWMATTAGAVSASATAPHDEDEAIAPGDLIMDVDRTTLTATYSATASLRGFHEAYTVLSHSADGLVIRMADPGDPSDTVTCTITRKDTGFTFADDSNHAVTFIPYDAAAVAAYRKKTASASAGAAAP